MSNFLNFYYKGNIVKPSCTSIFEHKIYNKILLKKKRPYRKVSSVNEHERMGLNYLRHFVVILLPNKRRKRSTTTSKHHDRDSGWTSSCVFHCATFSSPNVCRRPFRMPIQCSPLTGWRVSEVRCVL